MQKPQRRHLRFHRLQRLAFNVRVSHVFRDREIIFWISPVPPRFFPPAIRGARAAQMRSARRERGTKVLRGRRETAGKEFFSGIVPD